MEWRAIPGRRVADHPCTCSERGRCLKHGLHSFHCPSRRPRAVDSVVPRPPTDALSNGISGADGGCAETSPFRPGSLEASREAAAHRVRRRAAIEPAIADGTFVECSPASSPLALCGHFFLHVGRGGPGHGPSGLPQRRAARGGALWPRWKQSPRRTCPWPTPRLPQLEILHSILISTEIEIEEVDSCAHVTVRDLAAPPARSLSLITDPRCPRRSCGLRRDSTTKSASELYLAAALPMRVRFRVAAGRPA